MFCFVLNVRGREKKQKREKKDGARSRYTIISYPVSYYSFSSIGVIVHLKCLTISYLKFTGITLRYFFVEELLIQPMRTVRIVHERMRFQIGDAPLETFCLLNRDISTSIVQI